VMAMASGNSLFIFSLLCDPSEEPSRSEVIRVIGNIGRPGLAMLIVPESPMTKDAELGDCNVITHTTFKEEVFDEFKFTSMHLSFTGYMAPLSFEESQEVQEVESYLLEGVILVYHGGE